MEKSHITTGNLLKFLLGSAFGILMFLVPIPQGESFTTLLDFLKSWIKGLFGGRLSYLIMVILIVSAIMSLYDYIAKPDEPLSVQSVFYNSAVSGIQNCRSHFYGTDRI